LELELAIDNHHLRELAASPRTGVLELIWNALDADASRVEVRFIEQALGGLEEIRIADNGHGMTHEEASEAFQRLGGSWKQEAAASKNLGRVLHGKSGQGRFRGASMGQSIRWTTVAESEGGGREKTTIEIQVGNLKRAVVSDAEGTDEKVGTEVVIAGFVDPPTGLRGETARDYMISHLAPYLQKYRPDVIYDGAQLDAAEVQEHFAEYPIKVDGADPARLEVIEWNRPINRVLCLCNEAGMTLAEEKVGIQAPGFDFTAYICWPGFEDHSRLQAPELDEKSAAVLDASRQQLRSHFKDRGEDERRRQVGEWKAEKVYPFDDEPDTATESASRELFDVVAVTARDAVNAGETRSKALSLRLLREAIEQNPGSLRRVLDEVLGLSEDDLEELDKLLDQTSLPKLIAASRAITNRLDFLAGLEHLVLDKEVKAKLLERSQLHRILADETWVFGEEFALTADDESLNSVLKAHIHLLGRDELAPAEQLEPVEGAGDRKRAIVDLMLAREIPQSRNRLEHLVVELKRPSVAIGPKELQQVRDYASAVASDDRFDKSEVEWDFFAVSTALAGTVEEDANQAGQPRGLTNTYKQGRVRVWAKTWGELIEDARHRHKFVKDRLDYAPSAKRAFQYLKEAHAEFLPASVAEEQPSSEAATAPQV
jgi:Histidine kinase-, DNA gyrase B-, and HSP90-like ATPase